MDTIVNPNVSELAIFVTVTIHFKGWISTFQAIDELV